MSDLISRQDAIDAVEKLGIPEDMCVFEILSHIELAIGTLPSAQPEQRWIPCSESLPNTNGIYIVTRRISDGFECRNITDACYFDGLNTWHDDTRVNHERKYLADVLAWMPLPEPWKGEKEEGEPIPHWRGQMDGCLPFQTEVDDEQIH